MCGRVCALPVHLLGHPPTVFAVQRPWHQMRPGDVDDFKLGLLVLEAFQQSWTMSGQRRAKIEEQLPLLRMAGASGQDLAPRVARCHRDEARPILVMIMMLDAGFVWKNDAGRYVPRQVKVFRTAAAEARWACLAPL